jgi:PAS domain S-box-containing protein
LWWWVGDAVGILLITPVLLTQRLNLSGRFLETLALTALLVATSATIFFGGGGGHPYPFTFLVAPPLAWAASRFGSRGASLAALATATIAIAGTLAGRGPFTSYPLQQGLLLLELCVSLLSAMALLLAAEVSEREQISSYLSQAMQEQARAQQELRHSEQRFRLLADHASDIIAEFDAGGKILYVSPGLTTILGRSIDAIIGQSLPDIIDELIHPDDRQKLARGLTRITEDSDMTFRALYRARHVNGEWRWFETRSQSFGAADGTVHAVSVHRDVTERERADARFRLAVEASPAGALMIDANGRIVLINRAAASLFGYERDELIGRSIEILVAPAIREKHPRFRAEFLLSPTTRAMGAGRDLYGVRKDGSEVPVEIGLNPIETDEGVFVLSSIVDITERKRAESTLALADRMSAVGTLAAGVAHGMNNPLAYVKGNLVFAKSEIGDILNTGRAAQLGPATVGRLAEVGRALGEAEEGANRVRDLVSDLLTFSRHREEPRGTAQLTSVLDSVLQMTANEIRHRARLAKSYKAVPGVVGEASRLAHVFTNLIVNAVQCIPEGHAESNEIRVSTWTDSDGWAVIEIRDTGGGIAPDLQTRVFEPFFTTKPIGSGTGLGLPVAHGIVSALGGRIDLESELGRGTVFRVRLPAWDGKRESKPADVCGEVGRMRLLLVDDDPLVLRVTRRQLEREHEVLAASSGEECLALLRQGQKFDAILCDLMMPVMTGMQLYEAMIEELPRDAERMVFVTGGVFTEGAQQFLEHVPNLRLAKPIEAEALRRALAVLAATS